MKFELKAGLVVLVSLSVAAPLLALPVNTWRIGEMSMPALTMHPGGSLAALPNRVWIDTEAACDTGPRVNPEDCLAPSHCAKMPGST